MALVSECCGWDRETDLIACWRQHQDLFPHLPSRTRFNRRRRALQDTFAVLRQALLATLDLAEDPHHIIDSLPLPVVQFYHAPHANTDWAAHGASFGKCASKKQTIFGYKLHLLITLNGVIRDFALASAHEADLTVGVELLAAHQHLTVLGDKGYIIAAALQAEREIALLTIPRTNQKVQVTPDQRRLHQHVRQLIETVNSQLAQQFHIEVNHAHSFWGLTARLWTKLTAHTLCLWLNRLLGTTGCLQIKHLAFPI